MDASTYDNTTGVDVIIGYDLNAFLKQEAGLFVAYHVEHTKMIEGAKLHLRKLEDKQPLSLCECIYMWYPKNENYNPGDYMSYVVKFEPPRLTVSFQSFAILNEFYCDRKLTQKGCKLYEQGVEAIHWQYDATVRASPGLILLNAGRLVKCVEKNVPPEFWNIGIWKD